MNAIFGDAYAGAYDLLYGDKDYVAECETIRALFERYADAPVRSVIDLGCGSGNHALPLAMSGLEVTGVDRSAAMLQQARRKAEGSAALSLLAFAQGDIRDCRLHRTFDAALMLFAVLGYQISDDDVVAALTTARAHLEPGGLFIFDCWYGPAVMAEGPSDRVKTVGNLTRFTHSTLDASQHTCEVRFRLENCGRTTEESHTVRFFFRDELTHFLEQAGFTLVRLGQFPDINRDPNEMNWNVMGVARATAPLG